MAEVRGGPPRLLDGRGFWCRRGWRRRFIQPGEEMAQPHLGIAAAFHYLQGAVEKTRPWSSPKCKGKVQDTTVTGSSKEIFYLVQERSPSQRELARPGRGCPESPLILHPWRSSKLAWTSPAQHGPALKLAPFAAGGWMRWPPEVIANREYSAVLGKRWQQEMLP